jgi:hypothetical protein
LEVLTMARTKLPTRRGYLLRLPPDVYAEMEAAAAREDRSLNAQITAVLKRWLGERKGDKRKAVAHGS